MVPRSWSGRKRHFPLFLDLDEPARRVIEQATEGAPALIGSVRFDEKRRPRNSLFALTDGGGIAAFTTSGTWCRSANTSPIGCRCRSWCCLEMGSPQVPDRGRCTFQDCRRSAR